VCQRERLFAEWIAELARALERGWRLNGQKPPISLLESTLVFLRAVQGDPQAFRMLNANARPVCPHGAQGLIFQLRTEAGGEALEWCPGCGAWRYLRPDSAWTLVL